MASALRLRLAQCMRSIPGDRLQTVEAIQQDGLPCYAFQFVRGDALTCVPGGSQAFCVRPVVLAQMSFDNGEDVSDRDRLDATRSPFVPLDRKSVEMGKVFSVRVN